MNGHNTWLLSPKNLYRLITGRLSGLCGNMPVVSKTSLHGITVTSFYQNMLKQILPGETMEVLFPHASPNPRVQSNLINRTGTSPVPAHILAPLESSLNRETFKRLVSYNMLWLDHSDYNSSLLTKRLDMFGDRCREHDMFLTEDLYRLLSFLRDAPQLQGNPYQTRLFLDAYRYSLISLLSFFGPHMGSLAIMQFFSKPELQPDAMWAYLQRSQDQKNPVSVPCCRTVSSMDTLLFCTPLSGSVYVPLPLTPERVCELLKLYGKLVLTGIGGSGKTELVRQALAEILSEGRYTQTAIVQYAGTLSDSLVQAFPQFHDMDQDALFSGVRNLLDASGETTLLLVDNVDAQDPDLGFLSSLSCDVIATSRQSSVHGLRSVPVPALTPDASVQLFTRITGLSGDAAQSVCRFTGGHPLTIQLLGGICSARFWSAEELLSHLEEMGFSELNLVQHQQISALTHILMQIFDLDDFPDGARKTARLMAMLPCRTWTPDEFLPLAPDITENADDLMLSMQMLADRFWLMRGKKGYVMHPAIAEALHGTPYKCDEFPMLWASWAKELQPPLTEDKQKVYGMALTALLLCQNDLNRDGLRVLRAVELTAMTRAGTLLRHDLPEIHTRFLESHKHTQQDTLDLAVIRMLWALLGCHPERFPDAAEDLLSVGPEILQKTDAYDVLLNVLEIGGNRIPKSLLDTLFERARPKPEHVLQTIQYLNFLGGKQRYTDKAPQDALTTLREARALIVANHMEGGVEEAANDTRMAYCFADLCQWSESLPLMRRVLENLRRRGYQEDSQTMVATMNSYTYFRGKCTERQVALDDLEKSIAEYHASQSEGMDLVTCLESYALLLMDEMRLPDAEAAIREAVRLCKSHYASDISVLSSLCLTLGQILYKQKAYLEALGSLREAELMSLSAYGELSAMALRAQTWQAMTIRQLGNTQLADTVWESVAHRVSDDCLKKELDDLYLSP